MLGVGGLSTSVPSKVTPMIKGDLVWQTLPDVVPLELANMLPQNLSIVDDGSGDEQLSPCGIVM